MNHLDTDTTQTDWSEFGRRNETARCPITGVSTMPALGPVEHFSNAADGDHPGQGGRSKSKLQIMFDKFLYQK